MSVDAKHIYETDPDFVENISEYQLVFYCVNRCWYGNYEYMYLYIYDGALFPIICI